MPAAPDSFDAVQLLTDMRGFEGYRAQAYVDSVGLTTIGIGRELTRHGLSDAEILYLYENDVAACCADMDAAIPWWRNLAPRRQRAMISLCFMGWASLAKFSRFLAAMQAGHWTLAVAELRNSKWWAQVGRRGPATSAMILSDDQS